MSEPTQSLRDFIGELEALFARFESTPESVRQEFLGLFEAFLAQLSNSRIEPASDACHGVGGLQIRLVGVAELRAAALRALDLHLGTAHG